MEIINELMDYMTPEVLPRPIPMMRAPIPPHMMQEIARQDTKKEKNVNDNFNPNTAMQVPAVYKLRKDKKTGVFDIRKVLDFYVVPDKVYDNLEEDAAYFFRQYKKYGKSMGVLYTGDKGTGKSESIKLLSNMGILNDMPVLEVTGIQADMDLLQLLDNVKDTIVVLDEFGKVFTHNVQEKMLSFFSDFGKANRLILVSENHLRMISDLLLDRPGRLKYHKVFGKLKFAVVKEYCRDEGASEDFIRELEIKYDSVVTFSFDQLDGILEEHLDNPTKTLDDLIVLLNVKSLFAPERVTVVKIIDNTMLDSETKGERKFQPTSVTKEDFNNGNNLWIRLTDNDKYENVTVSKSSVIKDRDGIMVASVNNQYMVTLEVGRNGGSTIAASSSPFHG